MSRRCRRTDPHLCTLGAHHDRPAQPSLLLPLSALCAALALFLAAGGWRA